MKLEEIKPGMKVWVLHLMILTAVPLSEKQRATLKTAEINTKSARQLLQKAQEEQKNLIHVITKACLNSISREEYTTTPYFTSFSKDRKFLLLEGKPRGWEEE